MKKSANGADLIKPRELAEGLHIETNASSELIVQWLSMLRDREKPKGFLQIVTNAGKTVEVPEA